VVSPGEARGEAVEDVGVVAHAGKEDERPTGAAPIEDLQPDVPFDRNEAGGLRVEDGGAEGEQAGDAEEELLPWVGLLVGSGGGLRESDRLPVRAVRLVDVRVVWFHSAANEGSSDGMEVMACCA